jgi:hypothetical protein
VRQVIRGISKIDSYCLTVLIDEYHPKHGTLLITDYINFLEDFGQLLKFEAFSLLASPFGAPQKQRRDSGEVTCDVDEVNDE